VCDAPENVPDWRISARSTPTVRAYRPRDTGKSESFFPHPQYHSRIIRAITLYSMATTDHVQQNGSPNLKTSLTRGVQVADDSDEDTTPASNQPSSSAALSYPVKHAIHRVNAPGSVQALAIDDDVIFGGTQGGSIVVWSLETYERLASVQAHKESVLSLTLSEDRTLLFSTGADSIVNIWSTESLQRLYSLYSHFEIGDVFCSVHSRKARTLFWGAQNASIQWYQFSTENGFKAPVSFSPGSRKHRFFDSLGPGGTANLTSDEDNTNNSLGGRVLTIPSQNYLPYAHKSYIYSVLLAKGVCTPDKDDEVLISGAGDGTIKIWATGDPTSSGPRQITKFKTPGASILTLSQRSLFLYAGLSDGVALIYNLTSNQLVQKLQVGHGDVSQITLSAESVLCGTSEGWVKVTTSSFC
jgi:di- and tripeptidase